jgi:hypothetical protein
VVLAHFDVIIHTMKNQGGRKQLGEDKRNFAFKVHMNQAEVELLRVLMKRFHLDMDNRGTVGPFLRKWIFQDVCLKEDRLPDSMTQMVYEINKIGTNINQLTKVIHYKDKRQPNASLNLEVQQIHGLLMEIWKLLNEKST